MCPVCQVRAAVLGILCTECRDEIAVPIRATSEQVQLHGPIENDTEAALVDVWGRAHPLSPSTLIGRSVDGHGLAVLEASISRHHARIVRDTHAWSVRDLGSANGTFVDDQPVDGTAALHAGARVRFGQMAFYFLPACTARSPDGIETSTVLISSSTVVNAVELRADPELEEERTDPGMPTISLKLHEPAGGGGGFVEVEGKPVQLTATQLGLMSIMVQRMTTDTRSPPLVRGFVRSSELIAALPWDTTEPNENHVKQLVRRVRRVLMKVAHGDLIESRHRFGYRLRAIPRAD